MNSLRFRRLFRISAATLAFAGGAVIVVPAAGHAATRPSLTAVKRTPVRWLTVDGGSISVEQAMAIAAAGGNPNTVSTRR